MFAVASDLRAQIAGRRLSPIPQGNEEAHSSSDAEGSAAQHTENTSKPPVDEETAQQCSEPEAPSTPKRGESLPASTSAHSHSSQHLNALRCRASVYARQSRSRRCDLSGQWVPVVAAAAIVMVITAASMYSASALSSNLLFSAPLPQFNLTRLSNHPDLQPLCPATCGTGIPLQDTTFTPDAELLLKTELSCTQGTL